MKQLTPLVQSHHANQVDAELDNLLIVLYQKLIYPQAHDANVNALPFLGSVDLIAKYLIDGNLAKFDSKSIPKNEMRYLLNAYKYRNGKRGLHLMRTFLKCVWGNEFDVEQLYQNKNLPYPTDLQTLADIRERGLNEADFFLTSRLRLSLSSAQVKDFPVDVASALAHTLPARLFIAEILKIQQVNLHFGLAAYVSAYSISYLRPVEVVKEKELATTLTIHNQPASYSIVYGTAVVKK